MGCVVDRPLLAVGDGPVVRYRRWAKQFYATPAQVAPAAG
jgi:hypothetical protein